MSTTVTTPHSPPPTTVPAHPTTVPAPSATSASSSQSSRRARGSTSFVSGVGRSFLAELARLRRAPVTWITIGVWLLMTAMFGFVFDYFAYRTGNGFGPAVGKSKAELLSELVPANLPMVITEGTPLFGGALMLVLGAVIAGSGYGWGTWKTAYLQGPSRASVATGSAAALVALVAIAAVAMLTVAVIASTVIASVESATIVWPDASLLGEALATAFFVMLMWGLVGFTVATLTRGTSLAIGLGLVWMLAVETLLRGVGDLLGPVGAITDRLPGTGAGSLVYALGQTRDNIPGVVDVLSGPAAWATVAAYVVVLPLIAITLVRRRDLT